MKKILILSIASLVLVLSVGPASAWYGHRPYPRSHFHFGVFIGPPVILLPPPPPVRYYYDRSDPPVDYYEYDRVDRVWVPGYWEYRKGPYGWERFWVPGHWEWR
ncbi:MAG: hypothetical protein ACUVWO_07455 [Thermodesulfobacteriota bacterium]